MEDHYFPFLLIITCIRWVTFIAAFICSCLCIVLNHREHLAMFSSLCNNHAGMMMSQKVRYVFEILHINVKL